VADLDELDTFLDALARTSEAPDAAGFRARNRAIDELELHLGVERERPAAGARIVALRDRMQAVNDSMARALRERIAAGGISSPDLLATFRDYVGAPRAGERFGLEYDDLDALVAGILSTDQLVEEAGVTWDPEMVPYQPTPARLILELLPELRLSERDVFVDVGSGLGTVPALVSLLTPARAVGIEWHPSYCAYARERVRALNLSSVSFVQQDAREADFSGGTVFYMFTPFKGTMLRDVLQRLDREGRRRKLRLCVYGPLLRAALRSFSSFTTSAPSPGDVISVFESSGLGAVRAG